MNLFVLENVKALLRGHGRPGLAKPLPTQCADFLQGAGHHGRDAVRGLSAPRFQDLGYFRWIAGTQVTKSVHGC